MTIGVFRIVFRAGTLALVTGLPAWADASDALVQNGQAIFEENCEVCHQADAIGQPGIAPSLTNPELLSIASDKYFMATIRDGRDGTAMAPFDYLGRKDIRSVVAYLRSHEKLPNRAAEVNAEETAQGDPRLGKLWFDNICSTCHGVDGNGYDAGGTGTAIGYPGLLDKASDGFLRDTIKYGRSNTRMRGFSGPDALANLNDNEIDDVIAYLRELGAKNASELE